MARIFPISLIVLLAPSVLGQSNSAASSSRSVSPSTASSAASTVQTIEVGESGLVFTPETLSVPVGGTVEFRFYPKNHSVAQSSFEKPCEPLSSSAFFSGYFPVNDGLAPDVFTITVNDTKPIWFYCTQVKFTHCQAGMVGVINPPASGNQTIGAFKAIASTANSGADPASVQGGIVRPASGGPSGSTSASASGSSTAPSSTSRLPSGSASRTASSSASGSAKPTKAAGGARRIVSDAGGLVMAILTSVIIGLNALI